MANWQPSKQIKVADTTRQLQQTKEEKKKMREHQLLMIDYKSYYLSGRTTWLIKTGKMKSYAYLQMQHIFYDYAFT